MLMIFSACISKYLPWCRKGTQGDITDVNDKGSNDAGTSFNSISISKEEMDERDRLLEETNTEIRELKKENEVLKNRLRSTNPNSPMDLLGGWQPTGGDLDEDEEYEWTCGTVEMKPLGWFGKDQGKQWGCDPSDVQA